MTKGINKITKQFIEIPDIESITIIGDPGCDGLGAHIMGVFAKALHSAETDLTIIVGDIVPLGIRKLYDNVKQFINSVADTPVFALCGNHDTDYYNEYFGFRDYALYNKDLLIVLLDNSKRTFNDETTAFLKKALLQYKRENIVISFHIPVPNSVCTNSVSNEEWEKIERIISPYKKNIRYIICGHVHSYFEDNLDGIPLIVTGGGGARIEYVSSTISHEHSFHHIVKLFFDNQHQLKHEHISLRDKNYTKELADPKLKAYLEKMFNAESTACLKYRFFAQDALDKGYPGLASLFLAISDSEMIHGKNHFTALNRLGEIKENVSVSINSENNEVNILYKECLQYAEDKNHGLSKYSFFDAREAEKIHRKLLEEALDSLDKQEDIPLDTYYTCESCGFTFKGDNHPKNCPVCGAPYDKIHQVK